MTETDTDPQAALDAVRGYPIFLAHNANVDALTHVDADLAAALDPPTEGWPGSVDSPRALSTAIARTMERGRGDLLAMADDFDAWLDENVDPDEQRLGGQAAIMADLVALLDGDPLLYTYLLSEIQRELFTRPGAIEFPVVEDADLSVVPLTEAPPADHTKRNWIFEFSRDDRFFDATAAADTRFIAASRPDRFNLETGLEPVVDDLAESVECALVSGYQSLKYEYDDGSTFREHVEHGADFLRALADRGVTIQLEYGVTHKPELRRAIVDEVLPEVHAAGMDTRELELLCEDLRYEYSRPGPRIVRQFETLRALLPMLGIDCVKVHTTDYFLSVMDGYRDPQLVNEGWALSALVAATKAAEGVVDDPGDLETGLDYGFTAAGREALGTLADHLGVDHEGPGLTAEYEGVAVAAHLNRVVPDPVSTVGLGDSIAVSNFLLENALADRR